MVGQRKDAWLIGGLLAVYLILAAVLPAADDEVYYWAWARPLQFSYYDHPPMTAYMIRGSIEIFGDSIFAFRVPACLASAFVVSVIARLMRPRSLLPFIIITPLFTLGAVVITPDSPLLCAWAGYVWWLVEVHKRLTPVAEECGSDTGQTDLPWWMWLVGGVILGCGVLGKYTMALAVPSGFVSFCLIRNQWRRWLPGYIAHGVVSFIVASPILIYNIQHDFVPLLFQWRHSMGDSRPGLKPFGEFVGVQLLLFGTMPFFLYPWVAWKFRQLCENPRLRVCACLYALPMTFFLYKATRAPLQGNWALVMFVSFWPLAAVWYESVRASVVWRRLTAAGFIIPAAAVLVMSVHVLSPLPVIPIEGDRVTRQYALNDTTRKIAETIRQRGEALPVFTPTYQLTAWLRFQSLDGRQIDQISRPSHFTQHPEHLSDVSKAYVVADYPLPAEFAPGFEKPELIGTFPVVVRGQKVRDFQLLLYSKSVANRQAQRPKVSLVNYEVADAGPTISPDDAIVDLRNGFGVSPEPERLVEPAAQELKPTGVTSDLRLQVRVMEAKKEDIDRLGIPNLNILYVQASTREYDAKLDELRETGKLKVTAEATLALEPSVNSRFISGGEISVPVPNPFGVTNTEYREFGFSLSVTPTFEGDDRVKLDLLASWSELDMNNAVKIEGVTVPGISRRRLLSTVTVPLNEPQLIASELTAPQDRKSVIFRFVVEGPKELSPADAAQPVNTAE